MEDLMRNIFSAALSPFTSNSLIVEIPVIFVFTVTLLRMFFPGGNR